MQIHFPLQVEGEEKTLKLQSSKCTNHHHPEIINQIIRLKLNFLDRVHLFAICEGERKHMKEKRSAKASQPTEIKRESLLFWHSFWIPINRLVELMEHTTCVCLVIGKYIPLLLPVHQILYLFFLSTIDFIRTCCNRAGGQINNPVSVRPWLWNGTTKRIRRSSRINCTSRTCSGLHSFEKHKRKRLPEGKLVQD